MLFNIPHLQWQSKLQWQCYHIVTNLSALDITAEVVQWITGQLEIPTIGIGAGNQCDGQVLVFHDLLGLFDQFVPKFVKQYAALRQPIIQAIAHYCEEVRIGRFPQPQHSFSMPEEELARLFARSTW